MSCHQGQRVGERRVGMNGDRVDHHAGFEFLDLAHLGGLHRGLEIAVNDADAAGLRHGDRHVRFGHGVHRRSDDRNIERDAARDSRADVDFGRQHVGEARLDQHVVEGQAFVGSFCGLFLLAFANSAFTRNDLKAILRACLGGRVEKAGGKKNTRGRSTCPAHPPVDLSTGPLLVGAGS